jgi:ABC-type glycerol-3-phosphate transport system substrate-binding protein
MFYVQWFLTCNWICLNTINTAAAATAIAIATATTIAAAATAAAAAATTTTTTTTTTTRNKCETTYAVRVQCWQQQDKNSTTEALQLNNSGQRETDIKIISVY